MKTYITLVDEAKNVLNGIESMSFAVLFNKISSKLFDRWREETPQEVSDEKLLEQKRGELYRLLTIDGAFFHNEDGTWTTIRPTI
ncbi:hypothetical protein FJO69_00345 [[Mycoplasma] falconis]|uniref:Uncharacterized protein n=1 Tax=[Mycoplasma] falconis TaxID=92403 RepID=A0A501XC34_9BACT|nr:hypothetical protein [[Mycoplasma] falconis]TPE58046.1 hypothetical protein FJO69_00345 [[Mycoplasma] falconis]